MRIDQAGQQGVSVAVHHVASVDLSTPLPVTPNLFDLVVFQDDGHLFDELMSVKNTDIPNNRWRAGDGGGENQPSQRREYGSAFMK